MKGFRFRLEPVLNVREHELDERRAELSRARSEAVAAAQRARSVAQRGDEARVELDGRLSRGLSGREIGQRSEAVLLLASRTRDAQNETRVRDEGEAQARARLLEARTRVRVLEILRERERSAYRREVERRERRDLDEAGTRLHWRRGEA